MTHRMRRAFTLVAFFSLLLALTGLFKEELQKTTNASAPLQTSKGSSAKRAILISLDGLDARYLREADKYGLKIPTLRRLMSEGATARKGVVAVYPSVTYPNHTTMVTGALPIHHGIFSNEAFNPSAPQSIAWHWFARDIRTDTLWDAAKRETLSTALISWPVGTGAGDWNVPEIWKVNTSPSASLTATLAEMIAHQRPAGLLEEIVRHNPSVYTKVTRDEGDDMRTGFAEYVIETKKPQMVFIHLFDLDHFQHDFGPFTPEAYAILEKSDAYVARILAAAERAGTISETAIFIMSDHGFRNYSKQIRPNVILSRAGLITLGEDKDAQGTARTVVTEWRAFASPTGGSCSIHLRDPNDKDALNRALVAFKDLIGKEHGGTREAGKGVLRILNQREVGRVGGNPKVAFMLEAADGYSFDRGLTGEPIIEGKPRGQHGYLPSPADYRASFIASGASIGRSDLGEIRMIDIAPTIARTLNLKLRKPDGRAVNLR